MGKLKDSAGYQAFMRQPPLLIGIEILFMLGVTYFAVRGGWKIIKGKLDASKLQKESKEADKELGNLADEGVHPTINNAQAQTFANSLVSAFAGCGTDEGAIINIMKQMKNDADIYLLIKTYGVRKYDGCNWMGDFGETEKSLGGAISDELDDLDKMMVNSVLRENGVKFQFT